MSLDILSFNTESGGRPGFLSAFGALARDPRIGVLCLQEVHHAYDASIPREVFPTNPGNRGKNPIRAHLFAELCEVLEPAFTGYFSPQLRGHLHDCEPADFDIGYGQAMFIRNDIPHHRVRTFDSFPRRGLPNSERHTGEVITGQPSHKVMQVVALELSTGPLLLGNVHGFWSLRGKVDCKHRMCQNGYIRAAFAAYCAEELGGARPPLLLVGDLNYTSQMEALAHLAQKLHWHPNRPTAHVLNHEFGIFDTRTEHYQKPVREADFMLACARARQYVEDMTVERTVPSDHATLRVRCTFNAVASVAVT